MTLTFLTLATPTVCSLDTSSSLLPWDSELASGPENGRFCSRTSFRSLRSPTSERSEVVRCLLSPHPFLTQDGSLSRNDSESEWVDMIRTISSIFLTGFGPKPCISTFPSLSACMEYRSNELGKPSRLKISLSASRLRGMITITCGVFCTLFLLSSSVLLLLLLLSCFSHVRLCATP